MVVNGILAGSFVLNEIALYKPLNIGMVTLGALICASGILLMLKKNNSTTECRMNQKKQVDSSVIDVNLSSNKMISVSPLMRREEALKNGEHIEIS